MRKIVVLEEAAEDIERGREFYELQLASEPILKTPSCPTSRVWGFFMGFIPNILDFIACFQRGFLFGIYYRETPAATEVFAILDLRRDPAWIRKKLKGRLPSDA